MSKLNLSFGAFADRLDAQLARQGFVMSQNFLERYQRDIDALIRCKVRGLIPDRSVSAAAKRLLDEIASKVTA